METLLQQLLEGQNKIIEEQKKTNVRLGNIEGRLDNVENHLGEVENRLGNVEGRLDNIEGNLAENTKFIHALSQDVARTATKEDIATVNVSIETLNTRLFKQEVELTVLKTAK